MDEKQSLAVRFLHPASDTANFGCFSYINALFAAKSVVNEVFFMQKRIRIFGSLKVLCSAAILTALSVIIAYICKFFTITPYLRVTFENLPIIFSGYYFGPVVGMCVGGASDFLNTAVSQYGIGGINPIITLGASCVGFMAGLKYFSKPVLRLATAVSLSHLLGNIIVKSAGLMIYYSYPIVAVLPRIPLYVVIGIIEFILLYFVTKSNSIKKAMGERS